jgi:hypothetical protein
MSQTTPKAERAFLYSYHVYVNLGISRLWVWVSKCLSSKIEHKNYNFVLMPFARLARSII